MQLDSHALAEVFPRMNADALIGLMDDIKRNGLREPIVLYEGRILDGRNRYRACIELGIEPMVRAWDGKGDPLAYVVSKNLHRRHLDESQRAAVVARIATLRPGANGPPSRGAAGRFGHATSPDPPIGGSGEYPPVTQKSAAAMLNVGTRSVQRAKAVLDKGAEEVIAAVDAGHLSVHAAESIVRHRSKSEQREIMAQGVKTAATVAHGITAGRRRGDRRVNKHGNQDAWPDARRQKQQIESEIWAKLKDAILAITGLPLPEDVARIARRSDKAGLLSAKLPKAVTYLNALQAAMRGESTENTAA